MSETVIRVENLSKLYKIGKREEYHTLRDSIARSFSNSFRFVRRLKPDTQNLTPNRKHPKPDTQDLTPNSIWALKDVSFEVNRGEVVGIIGRNGAGKSTLLKILSRISEPTEGCAEIRGRVGSLLEVGTGFHPELSGRENIYLNGAILGMKKAEIEQKFDEIVAFAEVEKFIDTPIKHYSSGMYVRLAFAVAAHLEPEILLVDEVLAVGDVSFQKKCLGKMGDVANEGKTIVLVSHNMASILQLSSQVVWLEQGEIAEYGNARSVVSNYLHDNRIPLGRAIFEGDTTHGSSRLTEIYVMEESRQIRPDVDYERSFYLVVRYEVLTKVDKLLLGLKLYNEQNTVVLHTATCDWPGTADGIIGEKGLHCAYVLIPGATLAPGRYYCGEIGLWSPGSGFLHHLVGPIMAFEITGGNLRTVGNEVLRPRWPWYSE